MLETSLNFQIFPTCVSFSLSFQILSCSTFFQFVRASTPALLKKVDENSHLPNPRRFQNPCNFNFHDLLSLLRALWIVFRTLILTNTLNVDIFLIKTLAIFCQTVGQYQWKRQIFEIFYRESHTILIQYFKACTLMCPIKGYALLLISEKNSTLDPFIRVCPFINFWKKFLPAL